MNSAANSRGRAGPGPTRRRVLRATLVLPAVGLAAGVGTPSGARGDGLAADIDLVGELLRTLHPGLLRYQSAEPFEAHVAALKPAFAAATDLRQRYLLLSRFLATLRCGHSYANFFNQRRPVQQALFEQRSRLPFSFRWIAGRMVVDGDGTLPRGTVVESLQGIPAGAVLHTLMPYARADGHNEGKRVNLLGSDGGARPLGFFDVFHGLVWGEPEGGVHRLRVMEPGRPPRTVELPALSPGEQQALAQARSTAPAPAPSPGPATRDASAVPWQFAIDAQGIATLTMPTWALYRGSPPWQAWLAERLDAAAAARGLVIDLRDNEGGLDCGNPILQRLLRQPSELPQRRLVRYRRVPEALHAVLDTWDPGFRDWGERARPFDDRFLELPPADSRLVPEGRPIRAPVAVLTSARMSSATFAFAQRCQADRVATLVGETTGGNRRGINGGAFFFVRLPASGLSFDLPLIGSFPLQPQPDAGVTPDLPVAVTAADLADGRDPVMARARRHLLKPA